MVCALQEGVDAEAIDDLLSAACDNGYKWVKSPHPRKPKLKLWKIQHERKLIGQCSVGDKKKLLNIIQSHREKAATTTATSTVTSTATATAALGTVATVIVCSATYSVSSHVFS